jgi:AbrB family looped-hinge helix DNA binding protein
MLVLQASYRYEERMDIVTVSPKYQVVIPAKVRRSLGIKPGQKIQVIQYEGRIELIPVVSMKKARGFLRGIDTSVERDSDRV